MFQIIRRWLGFSSPPRPPASGPTANPPRAPSAASATPDSAGPPAGQVAHASAAATPARNVQAPPVLPSEQSESSVHASQASATAGQSPGARPDPERDLDRPSLGVRFRKPIGSCAYLLQDVDVAKIAKIDVDLMVVDYSADGSDGRAFGTADVSRMKGRPSPGGQSAGRQSAGRSGARVHRSDPGRRGATVCDCGDRWFRYASPPANVFQASGLAQGALQGLL